MPHPSDVVSCPHSAGFCKGDFKGNLELVLVQLTNYCNLDCTYCYLPGRSRKGVMSANTLERIAERISQSVFTTNEVSICFHAGEPLAAGLDVFANAIEIFNRVLSSKMKVTFSVQTNGTLIDDDWAALFKKWSVEVGLSIDGPELIHDHKRKFRNGKGSHDRVVRGISFLKSHSVPFHVIAVITERTLDFPVDQYLSYFLESGAHSIALNVQEMDGINSNNDFHNAISRHRLKQFLMDLADDWINRDLPIRIRDFGFYFDMIRNRAYSGVRSIDSVPFGNISISTNGDFSTFSPELLGVKNGPDDFVIGNVLREGFDDAVYTTKFVKMTRDIEIGIDHCRSSCEYFGACGGGSPSNKLSELGNFTGTSTIACTTNVQLFVDVAIHLADRLHSLHMLRPESPAA